LKSIPTNIRVVVVENSDNHNFKKKLEDKFSNVECFLSGSNIGYAAANNLGLSKLKTKFALVLNPDTELDINAVNYFYSFVSQRKDFWLLGPANDQQKDFSSYISDIIEVKNLKGFAIFLNLEKFENTYFDENYFLYFEEIDLCRRVEERGGKIYLNKKILIKHDGASSVNKFESIELEKSRNWHWMWSTFYYHKKFKGYLFAFVITFPKLISSLLKTIFYQLIFNSEKKNIYFCRMSGILNSMIGKKSWYRPSID
jgi:GT2 family glycosyltransferase